MNHYGWFEDVEYDKIKEIESEWPFSGYIHSLKFYDRAMDINDFNNMKKQNINCK